MADTAENYYAKEHREEYMIWILSLKTVDITNFFIAY